MDQTKLLEEAELTDGDVGRSRSLQSLHSRDSYSNVRSLDHAHVVGTWGSIRSEMCSEVEAMDCHLPSPIARRMALRFFLTSLTTRAFWRGDTRPGEGERSVCRKSINRRRGRRTTNDSLAHDGEFQEGLGQVFFQSERKTFPILKRRKKSSATEIKHRRGCTNQ